LQGKTGKQQQQQQQQKKLSQGYKAAANQFLFNNE
jgi:hypothetical protein